MALPLATSLARDVGRAETSSELDAPLRSSAGDVAEIVPKQHSGWRLHGLLLLLAAALAAPVGLTLKLAPATLLAEDGRRASARA
jgi:hypothetical protein